MPASSDFSSVLAAIELQGTEYAREDDGRDVGVVELLVLVLLSAEETVREPAAGSDGDGGEEGLASDVSDGEDVGHVGRLELVVGDVALLVRLDTDLLEADVLRDGVAT